MTNAVIATYPTHEAAEAAVKALSTAGVDIHKLSIIGKDYETEDNVTGYYTTGDRMKTWGARGAFWGSIWGLLVGAGLFIVPGIGPVLVAGPLVATLVGALEGAVLGAGLSAIGAALVSLGVPKDSVLKYETAIKAGKFVLVYHGDQADADGVKAKLQTAAGAEHVESF